MSAIPEEFVAETTRLSEVVTRPFSGSQKIYVQGSRPDLKVGMREISQAETPASFGAEKNPPITVYDTSGPYTDPSIDIDLLNTYIADNRPNDNPGWKRARVSVLIKANESDYGDTEIMVEAFFERYGTPSALMLIPPSWVPVPSNGVLEEEVLLEIEERLTNTTGGAQ